MNITWTIYFLATTKQKCENVLKALSDLNVEFSDIEPYEKGDVHFKVIGKSSVNKSSFEEVYYCSMFMAKLLARTWTVTIPDDNDWGFEGVANKVDVKGVHSISFKTKQN